MADGAIEAAVISATSKTAVVAGSATGVLAWFQSQDWIAIGGFGVAVLMAVINWYYKRRHTQLEEKLIAARIAALQRRMEIDLSLDREIRAQEESEK